MKMMKTMKVKFMSNKKLIKMGLIH